MSESPIFLLASERSGTNLLRTRLDNHSKIAGPTPPHLLKWFYNIEPYYGNLQKDEKFRILIKDILELLNVQIAPWDINFDTEVILNEMGPRERSVVSLFEYVFDKYTEYQGKQRWFCKDNNLFDYAWKLKNYFPNCKFIYLVRDPRDVCNSNLNREYGPNTAYHFAKSWKGEQAKCIRIYTEKKFEEDVLLVKYENILSSPKLTFQKICEFIGEEFENAMLTNTDREEATKTKQWKNLSKPIMKDNKKKYKDKLKNIQIKIVEEITNREMRFLNYKLEYPNSDFKISSFRERYYKLKNRFNTNKADKKEKEIRKRKQKLRQKINKRYNI